MDIYTDFGGWNHTYTIFKRKYPIRNLQFYYGPSWVCLSREFVEWMLNYINLHPEFISYLQHSLNPDESIFQTLLMNSPFASTRRNYLHYVDWSDRIGKPRNSPNTLVLKDYEQIKKSGYLMARKFDITVDRNIVEKLLKNL